MPYFFFSTRPDDELFWSVMTAFGFTPTTLGTHHVKDPTSAIPALEKLRSQLKTAYRPRDWDRCVPTDWTRIACTRILRQFLHTRHISLRSRVSRAPTAYGGRVHRIYFCAGGMAERPQCVVHVHRRASRTLGAAGTRYRRN